MKDNLPQTEYQQNNQSIHFYPYTPPPQKKQQKTKKKPHTHNLDLPKNAMSVWISDAFPIIGPQPLIWYSLVSISFPTAKN